MWIKFQVKSIRETYAKVVSDKHEDVMAKFGAILAQGIIDAGKICVRPAYIEEF